ncbi:putative PPE family protein PPE32 [Mycobacterium attenuatum]|nr:PPE family protein [Mycobacterium attenuatum]VBA58282.1 putative PPE family protein PPE32 [Mycobacterium attenuatum]
MALDFSVLPPEVNSGRMYAGPGSGPLVAAAVAWDGLAAELNSTAASYRAVVSELTDGPWVGPSSRSMVAAMAPYMSWMAVTAAQAQQTAGQLKSAIAAYEAAFTATVPPPEIEVNRALLAALVATNILGQNTPAIMAAEAQYTEMWAQDAAAMYGYAGASAAATTVTPFNQPPATTNPGGTATQAATVAQATAIAGPSAQSPLSQLAAVPNALQDLALGGASFDPVALLENFLGTELGTDVNTFAMNVGNWTLVLSGFLFTASGITPLLGGLYGLALPAEAAAAAEVAPDAGLGALLGSYDPATSGSLAACPGGAGVSAGLGDAASVGKLSVPKSWTASPAVRLATAASPTAGLDGLLQAEQAGPGGYYGGIPPVGSVVNAPRGDQSRPRAGSRSKALPPWAAEHGTDEQLPSRSAPAQRSLANVASTLSERERDELDQLRKAIAEVAMERDAAARLIKEAIL